MSDRDTIFISHANPADNDFTAWLGGRLAAMGYRTWADFERAPGGTKHWQKIQSAIRQNAAKVLVVMSRAACDAEGVENEIMIAKGVEKEEGLERFIVPIKIGDLLASEVHPQLNNRIYISFQRNWGDGLRQLLDEFRDEGVPTPSYTEESVQLFSTILKNGADTLTDREESAFASWLPVRGLPNLCVYEFGSTVGKPAERLADSGIPAYTFGDYVLSFAKPSAFPSHLDIEARPLQSMEVDATAWLDDGSPQTKMTRGDRRRAFNGLMNSVWSTAMSQRGFVARQVAHDWAYFLPSDGGANITQRYSDPLCRATGPVTLVGYSKKWQRHWHAAISARSELDPWPHYALRLHVVFTVDGCEAEEDPKRAMRLRRRFCKSFWNDRWRRILYALLTRISTDGESLDFPTGPGTVLPVGFPAKFVVPYGIGSDPLGNAVVSDEVTDDEVGDVRDVTNGAIDDEEEKIGDG